MQAWGEPDGCTSSHAEKLVAYVLELLGRPEEWAPQPPRYPDGLALCVIDSVWSLGVRYGSVIKVVDCYRRIRQGQGADAGQDQVSDLLDVIDNIGGGEEFAARVNNRHRVSTASGAVLKAEAVHLAARALDRASIDSCDDLRREVARGADASAKTAWLAVPGQGSGLSWRYLLMLAGIPGVKPDRMICRFAARALELTDVPPPIAACLVIKAAAILDVSATALDHAIWRHERQRKTPARA